MGAFYRQCVLKHGDRTQVSWIPEQFAVVGKFLDLKGEDGWKVVSVGARSSEEHVKSHERDYLGHRSRTDI